MSKGDDNRAPGQEEEGKGANAPGKEKGVIQAVSRSWEIPFYVASIIILLESLLIGISEANGLLYSVLCVFLAMIFFVAPSIIKSRNQSLTNLVTVLDHLEEKVYDIDAIRREHRKTLTRTEHLQGEQEKLSRELKELANSLLEARKLNDEMMELRQERTRNEQKIQNIIEAIMQHCDFCSRTLTLPGLSGDYHDAVSKTLNEFTRMLSPLGFEVIDPGKGDPFNDRIHSASGKAETPGDMEPGHITECTQFGYRFGTEILRKADVIISPDEKPEGE